MVIPSALSPQICPSSYNTRTFLLFTISCTFCIQCDVSVFIGLDNRCQCDPVDGIPLI